MSIYQKKTKLIAEMNVVPYIDVMLVLLIIFMVTTPLLMQGVEVELPHSNAAPIKEKQTIPLIVTVNKMGELFLNTNSDPKKPLKAKTLLHRVAAEIALAKKSKQSQAVLVKGDRQTTYDKVIQAMVLLQKAGVKKVGLMTDQSYESS